MKKRLLFNDIHKHLDKKQITLILGARQTGKTTLLKQVQSSLADSDRPATYILLEDKEILTAFNQRPDNLFQFIPPLENGKRQFIFIDEVQYLNDPSNFLKYLYDEYWEQLKFVVTGSSGFYIDQKFKDSLAGRKRIFYLPTMGFREFLIFKDCSEIAKYAHADFLPLAYRPKLQVLLSEYLIYGGYPDVVLEPSPAEKQGILKELADSYVKKDALEAAVLYPDAYMKILRFIAGNIGGQLNINTLSNDLKIEFKTVEAYLRLMEKSFHISLVAPFSRTVSTELRKMKKAYFNDLGLRNYFVNNFNPIRRNDDRGELLENYVFRLLNNTFDSEDVRYWRTQKKQEVDFVVQEKQALEVKFSKDLYRPTKYKFFQTKYPDIPLQLIHFDNVLEFNLPNSNLFNKSV